MSTWERRSGESFQAFEAFKTYRDMGLDRSIQKVARKLSKSDTLIKRWSAKYDWVERAGAFDDEQDRKWLKKQEHERYKMAERHAAQSQMFQQKILDRIRSLKPEELSPSDLARWFDIAVKVERLSRGSSTEIAEVEHSGEVTEHHDVIQRVEKYTGIYAKLAGRSSAEGDNEGDDS